MTAPIIEAEQLGKQYRLGSGSTSQRFSEVLAKRLRRPFSRPVVAEPPFWALRDVSFKISQGEVMGIIGRNGAGKSTLLKILSRITEPSCGRVRLRGRVASLLEVGTGFHPELSGRENIFLNGAILGLQRAEITRRFDAIVDFAGTERFLETPVKRYSSGMYVRLAFAVAAHLEPEILVVDEVLAVGDSAFQQKCLGKMSTVAQSGRTVLFVSHNIGAVKSLCHSGIWLHEGQIQSMGAVEQVVAEYLKGLNPSQASGVIAPTQHLRGDGRVLIQSAQLSNQSGQQIEAFSINEVFKIKLNYQVSESIQGNFWFIISTLDGVNVLSSFQRDNQEHVELVNNGTITVTIDPALLLPGSYAISVGIFDTSPQIVDWVDSALRFEILPQFHNGRAFDHRYGLTTQEFFWEQS